MRLAVVVALLAPQAAAARTPSRLLRPGPRAQRGVTAVGRLADRVASALQRAAEQQRRAGNARRAGVAHGAARIVERCLGFETLQRTAVCTWVSAGVRPALFVGVGGSLVWYSGRPDKAFSDSQVYAAAGLRGPFTLVYSTGEGLITSLSLPVPHLGNAQASASPRKFAVGLAVPFGPAITAGNFEERGPFVGGAIGVGPVAVGACLYYPPLAPVARLVERPARAVQRAKERIFTALRLRLSQEAAP